MRNCLFFIAFGIALIFSGKITAQQTPQGSLYNFNRFNLNPAYAGANGCTEFYFSHLNQWVKVDGAPTTSFFSVNSAFKNVWGAGASLLVDKLGMLQQVAASGSLSYRLPLPSSHNLRLGITAGYYQFRVNPQDAVVLDGADVIVNGGAQAASSVNTEVGMMYQFKGLEVSAASKQILQSYSNFGYSGLEGYGLRRHLIGYVGYNQRINPLWVIRPSLLYKGISNVGQLDMNADVNYKNLVQFGLGYRTKVGLIGRVGITLRDLFFIGYAYEAPMRNIASYGSGSHEVILGLKLCRKPKEPVHDSVPRISNLPKVDTIVQFKYITDTIFIEKNPVVPEITDANVVNALDLASKNLEFEFDKAIILRKSYAELESLTNMLLIRSDLRIKLEGHTDNLGTPDYNMELSKNRVLAVRNFMVSNGVASERIEISYFGETKPVENNSTEGGRAKNRRVVMQLIKTNE
jgi:type IX secretion system PorP/SprF family membrane protein